MKEFVIPKVEIIRFDQASIFTTSCDPCPGCPPGSYGCPCVDSYSSDYSSSSNNVITELTNMGEMDSMNLH